MREDLTDIQDRLNAGRFPNEASVSQGIVQRLLHSLGWPVYDTGVVSPEYSLDGRRVDYALCQSPNRPIVLIEVKQVGQSDGADRQLFEYAFHEGVPMAILTDGREWSFFLPTEQGRYDERRLYKLDILEREPEETEEILVRYLEYEGIRSGRAIEMARKDYRNAARKREAHKALPDAWDRLMESEDELLIELLSEKVEDICGVEPERDSVISFLRGQLSGATRATTYRETSRPRENPEKPARKNAPVRKKTIREQPGFVGFFLFGERHQCRNAIDVLEGVFRKLDERNSEFFERFIAFPKPPKWKRPYLARSREALYPGKPELVRNYGRELRAGWWIDTNLSNPQKETLIHMACEVADIECGTDLRFNLG